MRIERHLSPDRLVLLSLGGSLLLTLEFWVLALRIPAFLTFVHRQSFLRLFILFLVPAILGFMLQYKAAEALDSGIAGDLWPEATLARLRTRLDARWLTWIATALWMTGLLYIFVTMLAGPARFHNSNLGAFAYFVIAPLMTLTHLRRKLKPSDPDIAVRWLDTLKPIISEHWGNGGQNA